MDKQTRTRKLCGERFDVGVTLKECNKYGDLIFRVSAGDQFVDIIACGWCDPFPNLICWLEAVAVGVMECSFTIDEERTDKHIKCRQHWDGTCVLIIEQYDEELLVAPLNTKQMVKAFYEGIRAFAASPVYDRRSWEGDRVSDRLLDAEFLPDTEADILAHLLTLTIRELKELIHKVAPICIPFPDPGPCNPPAEFHEILFSTPDPDNPGKTIDYLGSFWYWDVPDDYDSWEIEAKQLFLTEIMREKAPWEDEGTIFSEIHSDIIEKWLDKE